jgi:hypothetical protein
VVKTKRSKEVGRELELLKPKLPELRGGKNVVMTLCVGVRVANMHNG